MPCQRALRFLWITCRKKDIMAGSASHTIDKARNPPLSFHFAFRHAQRLVRLSRRARARITETAVRHLDPAPQGGADQARHSEPRGTEQIRPATGTRPLYPPYRGARF